MFAFNIFLALVLSSNIGSPFSEPTSLLSEHLGTAGLLRTGLAPKDGFESGVHDLHTHSHSVFVVTQSKVFWPAALKPDGSAELLEELAGVAECS